MHTIFSLDLDGCLFNDNFRKQYLALLTTSIEAIRKIPDSINKQSEIDSIYKNFSAKTKEALYNHNRVLIDSMIAASTPPNTMKVESASNRVTKKIDIANTGKNVTPNTETTLQMLKEILIDNRVSEDNIIQETQSYLNQKINKSQTNTTQLHDQNQMTTNLMIQAADQAKSLENVELENAITKSTKEIWKNYGHGFIKDTTDQETNSISISDDTKVPIHLFSILDAISDPSKRPLTIKIYDDKVHLLNNTLALLEKIGSTLNKGAL